MVLLAAASLSLATGGPVLANHSERDGAGRALHWNRSGTSLAQVYFVDYTGSRWPVNSSTVTWNNSSRVKSYYRTTCPSGLHCVPVYEYNSPDGNYGYAELAFDGNGHFTSSTIRLNNRYTPGAADDRQTVCQEEGHSLGLDHQYVDDTCMNDTTRYDQVPNGHDYDQLAAVYNH